MVAKRKKEDAKRTARKKPAELIPGCRISVQACGDVDASGLMLQQSLDADYQRHPLRFV